MSVVEDCLVCLWKPRGPCWRIDPCGNWLISTRLIWRQIICSSLGWRLRLTSPVDLCWGCAICNYRITHAKLLYIAPLRGGRYSGQLVCNASYIVQCSGCVFDLFEHVAFPVWTPHLKALLVTKHCQQATKLCHHPCQSDMQLSTVVEPCWLVLRPFSNASVTAARNSCRTWATSSWTCRRR